MIVLLAPFSYHLCLLAFCFMSRHILTDLLSMYACTCTRVDPGFYWWERGCNGRYRICGGGFGLSKLVGEAQTSHQRQLAALAAYAPSTSFVELWGSTSPVHCVEGKQHLWLVPRLPKPKHWCWSMKVKVVLAFLVCCECTFLLLPTYSAQQNSAFCPCSVWQRPCSFE